MATPTTSASTTSLKHPTSIVRRELALYSTMNAIVYGQLIFLCVLSIIFFISGVILNSLVIITILKSKQLRQKLCHCLIMVLSCFDLLTVVVGIQRFFIRFTLWLTENHSFSTTIEVYQRFGTLFGAISMLVLLFMCIERYLGVYFPIFHRTSVTRRRLLTSLAISTIFPATLLIISTNQMVISYPQATGIFLLVYVAPFVFFNYKLFKISRKIRRSRNVVPAETRATVTASKNVSSCLLAVACLVFFSIPSFLYVIVSAIEGPSSSNARLWFIWVATVFRMNCTFNNLIFFWKDKVLRREGMKVVKR